MPPLELRGQSAHAVGWGCRYAALVQMLGAESDFAAGRRSARARSTGRLCTHSPTTTRSSFCSTPKLSETTCLTPIRPSMTQRRFLANRPSHGLCHLPEHVDSTTLTQPARMQRLRWQMSADARRIWHFFVVQEKKIRVFVRKRPLQTTAGAVGVEGDVITVWGSRLFLHEPRRKLDM